MKGMKFLGLTLAAVAILATSAVAQVITVYGTNTYPYDVTQVQAAVSSPYTKIVLSGTFNFGTDGSVVISVPGITLQGAATGARIVGGTNPLSTLHPGEYPPAQTSGAKNLTIRNLRFEGWTGFAMWIIGIPADDNFTLIENNTLVSTLDWSTNTVYGIHYSRNSGSAVIRSNVIRNMSWIAISTAGLHLRANDSYKIYNNRLEECHNDGIDVDISDPFGQDPTIPINEGSVIIEDNIIHFSADLYWPWAWGIGLGANWLLGTSHALVTRNTITGSSPCLCAVYLSLYGHDRKIIGNNFVKLPTWSTQIADFGGRRDIIAGNILGPIDTEMAKAMGYLIEATGVSLISVKPDPAVYPDPGPTTNSFVFGNDYRQTGLPGWKFDAAGKLLKTGCVLLASFGDAYGPGFLGDDVTDNAVLEVGRFPHGTGGSKNQVLELPPHAYRNFILGGGVTLAVPFNPMISVTSMNASASVSNLRDRVNAKRAALRRNLESLIKRK